MLTLAAWACGNVSHDEPLTHARLQRLLFYCAGGILAFDLEHEFSSVSPDFLRGRPVFIRVYEKYIHFHSEPIPKGKPPTLSAESERVLRAVLNVYGRLKTFQLQTEVLLDMDRTLVDKRGLKAFFFNKFRGPVVEFPEHLFGTSSCYLSNCPIPTFKSLQEMSEAVTRILGT